MINAIYRVVSPKLLEIAYEEIDLKGNHVIVRPTYLSICKADQRYYQGSRDPEILAKKLPMALIHEGIGKVVYDGSGSFEPGDTVVIVPNTPVESDEVIGENYLSSSKFRSSGFDGFLQDYVISTPDRLVKINGNINYCVASFSELISVCLHSINRLNKFSHSRKNSIGVWGDGNVGFITAVLLKFIFPGTKIIVFGKNPEKLSYFTFADEICSINDVPDDLRIDHAFECVGGQSSQSAIDQIIDHINPEGTISLLGVSEYPVPINTRMVLEKGLRLYGSSRSAKEDFENTIGILEKYPEIVNYLESIIASVCPIRTINDISHAFEKDNQLNFGKTVLIWDK
ncbi:MULTISPECIES: ribitol-5-phosphate dehydrogenase [Methanobacterium]|jgi:ribitol-5-phosphate 2-dehydrogenase|uniref:Ribitol-5-phosphate dehydrogenase n=1 Tax=Methanobacterium veterum TaxID=408577 RepID=A0A9E5A8U6_9EURY|nr:MULTISPECIES: ribitol-5-phosphate dehydrogenase [Methanobacterium]MCZ3367109.1 ribitol-5-phosphate dehydrogenase [Methanobacterium veterum]MCZ3373743.1 ribitol-5-phosphate dehydrogenase [Methanobacterium veterum]